jgi:hypothetical protein
MQALIHQCCQDHGGCGPASAHLTVGDKSRRIVGSCAPADDVIAVGFLGCLNEKEKHAVVSIDTA